MKVLVIPSWYPTGEDELMGIYHKVFCEALSEFDNIEVDMLFIEKERLKSPFKYLKMPKKEVINEKNYNVYITRMLNLESISFDYSMKVYSKKLEQAFIDYTKERGRPDIIHAHVTLPAGYAACKIADKYNIPIVVTEHGSHFEQFFEGKKKKYGDFVLKTAYFTTVSEYMKNIMLKKTKEVGVIPNLVDTKAFAIKKDGAKALNLLCVSAFRIGKRIEDILLALKIIIEENPELKLHLTIVGDGYLKDKYINVMNELNLQEYVSFVGQKTKEEIIEIMRHHNIFVVASIFESFCIPGIEALASGMPVVATKCLGPEEYITKDCGILVEKDNPKSLADGILEVYHNLDKYDEEKIKKCVKRYSKEEVIKNVIKLYERIIKK